MQESIVEALVLRSMGNRCLVTDSEGKTYEAFVRGSIRLAGIRNTSPVVVGDKVKIAFSKDTHKTATIKELHPRKNYIIRRATNLSREAHILASNIDQAFLFVTLLSPTTTTTFIDRFLATAEAYSIPVVLLFNKIDLYDDEHLEQLYDLDKLYRSIGYTTLHLSAIKGLGCEQLQALTKGKITLLAGHSGVGKSTLTNLLIEGAKRQTQAINPTYDTGRHTTTLAEMIPLGDTPQQGYLIDTPGIKGFGTLEMDENNLGHYFREILQLSERCRFHNCRHLDEPDCAVIKALESGQVAPSRYRSYLSILADNEVGKYRPPQ